MCPMRLGMLQQDRTRSVHPAWGCGWRGPAYSASVSPSLIQVGLRFKLAGVMSRFEDRRQGNGDDGSSPSFVVEFAISRPRT